VRDLAVPVLVGAIAGGAVATVAWYFTNRAIDKQLASGGRALLASAERELTAEASALIAREVPPRVRTELEATLRRYNITPDTGRQISTVLSYADRVGLI
jgi:hypothetical protein